MCVSLWSCSAAWLTFSIQWHIADLRPLTLIKQCVQRYLIHCKYTVLYIVIWERNNIKMAISFGDMLSAELWHLLLLLRHSPVLTLTDWINKTAPLCAAASMLMRLNKMARVSVVMSFVLLVVPVTILFLLATPVTAVDSARHQKGERAIVSNREASSPSQPFIIFAPVNGFERQSVSHCLRYGY